jgi:hypothetical protein
VFIFVNFSFALFTPPPLGDYHVPTTQAKLTTSHNQPPSSVSGTTGSSASPDLKLRPREEVSASPDPALSLKRSLHLARPWARTDRANRGYIITLSLASSGYKEQDRRPIWLTPATGNDGAPRATMTPVALSPLRQQGDVSRIPATLPAVLLQGSGASPTATLSRVQGSSFSPTTTLACTQGLGISLPDTLAHSYTPHCTSGSSPCVYKREVQGHPRGGFARGKEWTNMLSLSLSRRACNPYYERHPWCRIIQGLSHLLCSIPRQPIWAGARSDNLTRRSKDPPGPKHRHFDIKFIYYRYFYVEGPLRLSSVT